MKYIRTKDGVFEVDNRTKEQLELYGHNSDEYYKDRFSNVYAWLPIMTKNSKGENVPCHRSEKVKKENIINQADTIEELCDEFVIKSYVKTTPFLFCQEYDDIDRFMKSPDLDKDTVVFGAIWTDKGLIYVAKMNKKGELELL